MLKINTNVIGIGDMGISAVNRISKANLPEIRTAILCADVSPSTEAKYILNSKHDFFAMSDIFFPVAETVTFIIADCSDSFEISLACELALITEAKGGFSVALAYMPSSERPSYADASHSLEELHECFDSVVRFNEGYCDDFSLDTTKLMGVLSRAMSTEALSGLKDFDQFKSLFERDGDIYFAYVSSKEILDCHNYMAKCLELKLSSQVYVDIANCLHFFYSSGDTANEKIIDIYTKPLKDINIAFMNVINTYITDNCPELEKGDFEFAVICAK